MTSPVLLLMRSLSSQALIGVCPTTLELKASSQTFAVSEDGLLASKNLLLSEAACVLSEQVWGLGHFSSVELDQLLAFFSRTGLSFTLWAFSP